LKRKKLEEKNIEMKKDRLRTRNRTKRIRNLSRITREDSKVKEIKI
jgi:hypothetical protein